MTAMYYSSVKLCKYILFVFSLHAMTRVSQACFVSLGKSNDFHPERSLIMIKIKDNNTKFRN